MMDVAKASHNAMLCYSRKEYPNPITLFRAQESSAAITSLQSHIHLAVNDPTLGWQDVCTTPVLVHDVPGNHVSMVIEPHVATLGDELRRCIRQAIGE